MTKYLDKMWKFRAIWAGIGGCVPILIKIIKFDIVTFSSFEPLHFLGWTIKTLAYFGLGALFGIAHKGELDIWELIKKGIVAPALAIILMSGSPQMAQPEKSAAINFGTTLNADQTQQIIIKNTNDITIYKPFYDEDTAVDKIYQGITGNIKIQNYKYVVAFVGARKSCEYESNILSKMKIKNWVFDGYWIDSREGPIMKFAIVIWYGTDIETAESWVEYGNKMLPTYNVRIWNGKPKTR